MQWLLKKRSVLQAFFLQPLMPPFLIAEHFYAER